MKKRDFILIGVIVAATVIAFAVQALTQEDGAYVLVKVDGEEVGRYSLGQDGEYELNGGTNVLRIEQGRAYLVSASCPNHLCVKRGSIGKRGETITCLPNRLTVTVYGADEKDVELVG